MNSLERFRAAMNYEKADRAPFHEFPWRTWPETAERWAREGGYDPETFDAGCDFWEIQAGWFMPTPPFERTVIEEDDEHVTYVDAQGITMKEFKKNPLSSMPQFIRFPVESREDFRKFWKERMRPDVSERIGPDWRRRLAKHKNRDYPFVVIADRWGGFFGSLRNMVGVERLCTLFYDDPDFVEEMMDADAQFLIDVLSQMLEVTDIDVFGFWEDMAYHTAPLISPEMVRKYMLERYRKVVDFGRKHGVHYFYLDSDGWIESLIPVWLDAGINIVFPFEPQAGMDVVAMRRKFGKKLLMWGGVDKRAVVRGPAAIDAELKRIEPLIREGGYVPMLDHSATPDTPYKHYLYFLKQLEKIL